MAKERCSEQVRDGGMWPRHHQCLRNGVVLCDGKWYCKQHDPVAVEKRAEELRAKYDAKWDKGQEEWRRKKAMAKVCGGISTDDLERLAPGNLARLLAKEAPDGS